MMRGLCLCSLALVLLALSGCTEVRVEGDATIFQDSDTAVKIRTGVGLVLLGLGTLFAIGSFLPDKKPKNRALRPNEKTPLTTRLGVAVFGGAMGLVGLVLSTNSLFFPNKMHVTVYPDRVVMASTLSQTEDKRREAVIPFAGLASVEIRDEKMLIGTKTEKKLVFTYKNGQEVKQNASNNEMQALETIRQALADYQNGASRGFGGDPPRVASTQRSGSSGTATLMTGAGNAPAPKAATADPFVSDAVQTPTPMPTPTPAPAASPATSVSVVPKTPQSAEIRMPSGEVVTLPSDFPVPRRLATPPPTQPSSSTPAAAPKSSGKEFALKRYVINVPLPPGHRLVGPSDAVEVGSKLKACYTGRWYLVTVVAVNNDGTISCNWDDWKAFTYKMLREDLVMAK